MKKLAAIILMIASVFTISACKNKSNTNENQIQTRPVETIVESTGETAGDALDKTQANEETTEEFETSTEETESGQEILVDEPTFTEADTVVNPEAPTELNGVIFNHEYDKDGEKISLSLTDAAEIYQLNSDGTYTKLNSLGPDEYEELMTDINAGADVSDKVYRMAFNK